MGRVAALPRSAIVWKVLLLALAFWVTGKLGLLLAIPPGYATAVWLPSGIALGAVLRGGNRVWPGILLGSFLVNIGTSFDASTTALAFRSLTLAVSIGLGASLQAVLGAALIRRFVTFPLELVRDRDVTTFLALGGPVACVCSATVGVTTLWLAGRVVPGEYLFNWWTWWLGDSIGVVVMTPLFLIAFGEPREVWRRRRWSVGLPLGFLMALVTVLFLLISSWEESRVRSHFEEDARSVFAQATRRIEDSIEAVRSVSSHAAAGAVLTEASFRTLVERPLARGLGLQAISWSPRIRREERPDFERILRIEDLAAGGRVAAGSRDEHLPILYIEPRETNASAIGFDVAGDPVRLDALHRARDSGEPAATPAISLIQSRDSAKGIIVYVPVYSAEGARGTAQWRGVLSAVFKLEGLLGELGSGARRAGLDVRLIEAGGEEVLWRSSARPDASLSHRPEDREASSDLLIGGRQWTLRVRTTPSYVGELRSSRPWSVLASGMLLAGLLGAFLLSTGGRAVMVERNASALARHNEELEAENAERRRVAHALLASQADNDLILNNALDAIIGIDDEGKVMLWNPSAERIFGWSSADAMGRSLGSLIVPPEQRDAHEQGLARVLRTGEARLLNRRVEIEGQSRDGTRIPVELSIVHARRGERSIFTAFLRDLREAKALEERLRQAQRMEVVGRLAGGIAHDFNNLLTPLVAYARIILDSATPGEALHGDATEILGAAQRASVLTKQLLAFSRKQVLQPRLVDPNRAVSEIEKLLQRVIGEDITLELALDSDVGAILVDPGQLEQVIMNLAVNARDAMPRGGTLTIRTSTATLEADPARGALEFVPGPHVVLSLSDTGTGMDKATLSHIFEPFFTTKAQGMGTGLGLATVYGIVQQSSAHIDVESEVGRGSTFRIFFPRMDPLPSVPADPIGKRPASGAETVLLVEDDALVRSAAIRILKLSGYNVLAASRGAEALEIMASHPDPIHLLLSDVVMPEMNGAELAKLVTAARPSVKVLFMSGYTQDAIAHRGVLEPGTELLEKPFTPDELLRKIREVLDRARA